MTTALNIIEGALRKIAVLGRGVTLSAEDTADALEVLNELLSSISAQGGFVFTETTETFNLTNAATYTIGSGGDFDTVRPLFIRSVYVSNGQVDYPLRQMDVNEYNAIPIKNIGGISEQFYYDAAYPLASITLYPVPTAAQTITLTTSKPLTQFATANTAYSMPDEYKAMLVYNLAEWIAPEYEREASPTVKRMATRTRNAVIVQNKRNDNYASTIDVGMTTPVGDIYGGYFR